MKKLLLCLFYLLLLGCTTHRAPTVQYVYTTNTQSQHSFTGISYTYDHSNLYGLNTVSAKLFIDGNEVWSTITPTSASTMRMQLPPGEHVMLYEIKSFNPVGAFLSRQLGTGGSMTFVAKFELEQGQVGEIKCHNIPLCSNEVKLPEKVLKEYEYDGPCTISKTVVKEWDSSMEGQFCPPGPFIRQ